MTPPAIKKSTTRSQLLVGVSRTELSTGEAVTLGAPTGVNKDFSESSEAVTTWPLSPNAPLLFPMPPQALLSSTRLPLRSRMIPTTTRLYTLSLRHVLLTLNALTQLQMITSSLVKRDTAVSQRRSSLMGHLRPPITTCQLISCQKMSTGETSMDVTSCRGPRISTSLNTVAHAGPRAPPVLLLTDSTSWMT